MLLAVRQVAEKVSKVGAYVLGVDERELERRDGKVQVRGHPGKAVTLAKIARTLRGIPGYPLPPGVGAGLEAMVCWEPESMPYANACHARSEEHTSELQSLMRISYAVFCLKKKKKY